MSRTWFEPRPEAVERRMPNRRWREFRPGGQGRTIGRGLKVVREDRDRDDGPVRGGQGRTDEDLCAAAGILTGLLIAAGLWAAIAAAVWAAVRIWGGPG